MVKPSARRRSRRRSASRSSRALTNRGFVAIQPLRNSKWNVDLVRHAIDEDPELVRAAVRGLHHLEVDASTVAAWSVRGKHEHSTRRHRVLNSSRERFHPAELQRTWRACAAACDEGE